MALLALPYLALGRYQFVDGATGAPAVGGARAGAPACGGRGAPFALLKKRKNSEVGDRTIVVPVDASAVL